MKIHALAPSGVVIEDGKREDFTKYKLQQRNALKKYVNMGKDVIPINDYSVYIFYF